MLRIFEKLRDWWRPRTKPQQGPRRIKHYAAQTGFHYQYQVREAAPGTYEFAIWTAANPLRRIYISVPLPGLVPRDRYALAKLHLFRIFDEHAPDALPHSLEVKDTAALDEL